MGRKLVAYTFGVIVVLAISWFVFFMGPGGSGVLASLQLPDGSRYMVTQQYTWTPEAYEVWFYMHSVDGPWGWCYIEHEAWRWVNVNMSYDSVTDTISITKSGKLMAKLNRKRNLFWIDNGSIRRELAAPQEYREPEFAFPK